MSKPPSNPADSCRADSPETDSSTAGLPRRLAALGYDWLLLAAVLFLFTLAVIALRGGRAIGPGAWWFQASLVAIGVWFFAWFWTHGGQTLGMRAWRLRVIGRDGEPIGWDRALLRSAAAVVSALPAGLGFWWSLIDRDHLCWHDRWSATRLVRVPRDASSA